MQSFKSKVLLSVLVLTLPSYVNANTKSEELHFKVLDGIDKAGEMATLGVEKLFSPLHKGVEKLAKPYIEKNNAEYFF